MEQYDKYNARELFDKIKTTSGSVRNYLVRLLFDKENNGTYITRLLQDEGPGIAISVLRLFSPDDVRRFSDILMVLSQKGNEEIKAMARERLAETPLHPVQPRKPDFVPRDLSIYKTWIRDPLGYPDAMHLDFFRNGTALYEEAKAGEVDLLIEFEFRVDRDTLYFIASSGEEYETGFTIVAETFVHPYHGSQPCLVLKFTNRDIFLQNIRITGTDFYHLYKNR